MMCDAQRCRKNPLSRLTSLTVVISFCFNLILPPVYAQTIFSQLPAPGSFVNPSTAFNPPMLRGLKVDPSNPLHLNFFMHGGDDRLHGEALEGEALQSIKYFLAALTVPETDLWVNLSPYEAGKIAPEKLGITNLGRDMLAQDYLLKQLTATLIYPKGDLGKKFWDKIHAKAQELYGTTEIPVNSFNKVWVIPDKAEVYEHNGMAVVTESHLKVMLDEDYLALNNNLNNKAIAASAIGSQGAKEVNKVSAPIIREVIIPAIEEEINSGKNFAKLRQIYNAIILAAWFKRSLQQSLLGQVYVDKNKVYGVDLSDKTEKEKIYQQYLEAFKKGVYNFIKEDYDPATQETVARKYISGGLKWNMSKVLRVSDNAGTPEARRAVAELTDGSVSNIDLGLVERGEPNRAMLGQRIYFFGADQTEGSGSMKDILGGKGAGLAEMAKLGMPVPPGFTITTDEARKYFKNGSQFPDGLQQEVDKSLARLEQIRQKKLGDAQDPLLVSVRSGAKLSMPGMMDTILNLGLNDRSVEGLASKTKNARFAYDSYRRLIEMYGDVVLGVDREHFTAVLNQLKESKGFKKNEDDRLTEEDFRYLAAEYKKIVLTKTGKEFPQDPREQLRGAIEAVFKSSNNERAVTYRRINRISPDVVSAVNVQSMVFGNTGEKSATGVAFTRDSATGKNGFNGEFLINAQGEDVVAGIRQGQPIEELQKIMPEVYQQLLQISELLEKHNSDMQDMEFTIEDGKLYMLQTRNAKRSALSMLRTAVEMAEEGLITKKEALLRTDLARVEKELMHPSVDPKAAKAAVKLATGTAASPGAAIGRAVFNSKDAKEWAERGEKVVLVRVETSPDDLGGMIVSEGILTAQGGTTSHAALVARGQGIPAVVGVGALDISYEAKQFKAGDAVIKEGDWITIDGSSGAVYNGQIAVVPSEIEQVQKGAMKPEDSLVYRNYEKLLQWADEIRQIEVWTNVDTPEEARLARELGAQGIGLTRTEHMFRQPDRLLDVQTMFLAKEGSPERESILNKIGDVQREDFEGILEAMEGLPVTIRLLDPPLHEFLPNPEEPDYKTKIQTIAQRLKIDAPEVENRIRALHETNPMLGSRGVRVAILNPSVLRMQAKAMVQAHVNLIQRGINAKLKIMVPNVAKVEEFRYAKEIITKTAAEIFDAQGVPEDKRHIEIGTMIEVPSAALEADKIAKEADFFSFGTNDLTQFTLGMSRDDAAKSFLPPYLNLRIFEADPTQKLDSGAVLKLIQIAVQLGRQVKSSLNIGICGEHGGEPSSINLLVRAGLNYVSASPLRLPIARLASAQTAIQIEKESQAKEAQSKEAKAPAGDKAMMAARNAGSNADQVGGIDLSTAYRNLQIKRDANGIPLPMPMQPVKMINIEGLAPVILNITPVMNVPLLLGVADKEENAPDQTPAQKLSLVR